MSICVHLWFLSAWFRPRTRNKGQAHPAFATFAVLLGLSAFNAPLRAASPDSALDAYEKRDFASARAEFEQLAKQNPGDPRLRFNAGDAAYRQRDYTNAAAHFESLLGVPDLKLQQGAYYNLGNARYLVGETARDPQAKLQAWQQSLTNFGSALKLDPKDTNAASNLAYMKQRVEELLKQMPQQQQQKQQKGDQDKEKKDPQDQQDQSQQGDQKPSPGDQQKDQQSEQQQAQQPDPKQDQGKAGEQEEKEKSQQAQQQAGKEPGKEGSEDGEPAAAEEAGKPGEMSPAQAARLLDNQKGEEKALVFQSANGKESRERKQRIRKPW